MSVRPAKLISMFAAVAVGAARATSVDAQGAHGPVRVLLLYQQQGETQPMLEFTERLRQTLRDELRSPVEFYQEALDFERFQGRERSSSLVRYFADKYRGFGIDVAVPVGTRALQFTVTQLNSVFPDIPVVFALNAAPQTAPAGLPRNVTGRLATAARFAPTIELARRLQPDAERLLIVGGSGASDSISVAAALFAAAPFADTLPIRILRGLSLNATLGQLRALSRRTIVLFANFRRDEHGEVFEPIDIIGSMARASAAPMYTQLRSYIGEGVLGGSVMRFDDEGARTGHLVASVLRRRPGEAMPPVEYIQKTYVVDWRQLRRWHLSEALLPPHTEVVFREPTVWERYRTTALLTLVLIGAQATLIGLLLIERQRRRRAQVVMEDQVAYEQTMAHLTTDAVRHAPDESPRALEDALARVGTYACASSATLVQYSDTPMEPPTRLEWVASRTRRSDTSRRATATPPVEARLEIPLIADDVPIGALELRRPDNDGGWSDELVRRLAGAGELIASAMARSRAARVIRRSEERAEETRRQVAHMGRVALVGELAATISHELRQPLAAIRANAEAGALLVAGASAGPPEAREIFKSIVADDIRAVELIDGIRKLLRKETAMSMTVDLNEICRQAVRLLQHDALLRKTRLELALEASTPTVSGDPVQLQQVVLNLTMNALDAASASNDDRAVVVRTTFRNEHVEVSVHDSGPGIPSEVQPHLFESYFSTKTHGLGLGLVIVRSIVERHNGRVRAENQSLGGAVFRVMLPAAHLK